MRNLAILDEDRLDFELLEALVAHIDESNEGQEGSILVFLPGPSLPRPPSCALAVCQVPCSLQIDAGGRGPYLSSCRAIRLQRLARQPVGEGILFETCGMDP